MATRINQLIVAVHTMQPPYPATLPHLSATSGVVGNFSTIQLANKPVTYLSVQTLWRHVPLLYQQNLETITQGSHRHHFSKIFKMVLLFPNLYRQIMSDTMAVNSTQLDSRKPRRIAQDI